MQQLEGVRAVRSTDEAERIAYQYEKAISRTSNYVCETLTAHVQRPEISIVEGFHENDEGSFVVGQMAENGVFAISHFAPKSLRSGVALVHNLARDIIPMALAVPMYQAKQAIKAGWHLIGMTRQLFNGELIYKFVLINDGVSKKQESEILNVCSMTLPRPCLP